MKKTDRTDEISRAILYDGANLSQLTVLFRMDHRVLVEKLHKCKPCGTRNGVDIYAIHEVAPYLVKPAYDIETYIKKMHHNDLPKMLSKEFWAGQRSRQEYLKNAGDLWPTARVVEVIGGVMKLIKMSARLMSDQVHRQAELTDKQRGLVRMMLDGMLEEMYHAIREALSTAPTNPEVIELGEKTIAEIEEGKPEEDDEL